MAILLLLCIFSNSAEARGEVPEDLIQAKETAMNEIALGANEGLTLTRTYSYNNGNPKIELSWNAVEGTGKYNVYQTREGEEEKLIGTVQGTEVTLNKANAEIKDDEPPTMPLVNATKNADETGYNITITPSTDKGPTYRHRITQQSEAISNADVIFLIDLSTSMVDAGFIGIFRAKDGPIITIAQELMNRNMRVGTIVMADRKDSEPIGPFTSNISDVQKYVNSFSKHRAHMFARGMNSAIQMFKDSGKSNNKIIILFTDIESDNENNGGENPTIKQLALQNMKDNGIKLYAVYRDYSAYIKDYCNGYIVQPNANKEDQVVAFNTIFKQMLSDVAYESNTVSTPVVSGIKGYKYAITNRDTYTFSENDPIVNLEDIPTYISCEENRIQNLFIVAVDNAGNESIVKKIPLEVSAKITLKSTYQYGMNYVPLTWTNNDTRNKYVYRLYQKEEGVDSEFKLIPSSKSEETVVRNETVTVKYTTPGTWTWTVPEGVTQIRVTVAGAGGGNGGNISYKSYWGNRGHVRYRTVKGGEGGKGDKNIEEISVQGEQKYTVTVGKAGTNGKKAYANEFNAFSTLAESRNKWRRFML